MGVGGSWEGQTRLLSPPNRPEAHWSRGESQRKYFDHSESEIDPVRHHPVSRNILPCLGAGKWNLC